MLCHLCPRECGAERTETFGAGLCRMPFAPVLAKVMLHEWEEPCLSGAKGAGAVFFSGCNLRCRFCQNHQISHGGFGKSISVARLRAIFEELVASGASCLDLVTPTPFTPMILEALGEKRWDVPVVWNCGGYEKVEILRQLEGKVNVFLPDFKYALPEPAEKYSGTCDYPEIAMAAIREMFRQTGPFRIEKGILRSGVLIRHLVLPGELENTRRCLEWIARTFRPGDVLVSLMSQYTPQGESEGALSRPVSAREYERALDWLEEFGIEDGFTQEPDSASSGYTPVFDLQGVEEVFSEKHSTGVGHENPDV